MDLHDLDLWQLLALVAGLGALLVLTSIVRSSYPILLVLGGLALAFVPGSSSAATARSRTTSCPACCATSRSNTVRLDVR